MRVRQAGMSSVSLVLLVCFISGLLLGPGHIIYCLFFSGASAAEHPYVPGQEVTFSISPEQNPLRLNANFVSVPPRVVGRVNRRTEYEGELRGADGTLWRERFDVSYSRQKGRTKTSQVKAGLSSTKNIRLFSVEQAGDYTFVAKQEGERSLTVRQITLELRQNVAVVNTPVAVLGCALTLGAFVSVILGAGFRGRRREERGAGGHSESSDEPDPQRRPQS